MSGYDCDYLVIGSGFGGAVSALRLTEKGHRVIVLEKGRRIGPEEIAASRKSLRKLAWQPELGMHGFFWQRLFRHVGILGATGVGGGSLVFGGVLIEPKEAFYQDPAWADLGPDWRAELGPHYETAKRMLGRAVNPSLTEMDDHLKATAEAMGVGDSFGPVPLAVFFGPEAETVPDPFFRREGPERTGCRFCGGCLVGCPYGSKNSLDYNYLYLAERRGAEIRPEQQVTRIEPLSGGGYVVHARHPWRRRRGGRASAPATSSLPRGCWARWSCCSSRETSTARCRTSPSGWVRRCAPTARRSRRSSTATPRRTSRAGQRSPRTSTPTRSPTSPRTAGPRTRASCATRDRWSTGSGRGQGAQDRRPDACPPHPHAARLGRAQLHQAPLRADGDAVPRQRACLPLRAAADGAVALGLRSVSVPGKKAPTYLAVANEATRKFAEVSVASP